MRYHSGEIEEYVSDEIKRRLCHEQKLGKPPASMLFLSSIYERLDSLLP